MVKCGDKMNISGKIVLSIMPIISATAIAFSILGMEESNMWWIAIITALIGVFGSVIVAIFQLKRDGKTIDATSRNVLDIKPKVDNISDDTKKIRDVVIESINPTLSHISEKGSKIDFIASEIEYQKRLHEQVSHDVDNRDIIVQSIDVLYEKNASLNKEVTTLKVQNNFLSRENNNLKNENQQLKSDILDYKRDKNCSFDKRNPSYDFNR